MTDPNPRTWDVAPHRPTQAEDTAAILLEAALSRSPVLIPGALDIGNRPAGRRMAMANPPVTLRSSLDASGDRERLEREREGGGAPSERGGVRRDTIFRRLFRYLLRPTVSSAIRRRPLNQQR